MINADFTNGLTEVTTEKLHQWDIGQRLQISGITPSGSTMQVHFANTAMKQAIVKEGTFGNNVLTVDIPNEFLQSGGAVHGRAWLYCFESGSSAKTVKTIYIPVEARRRPNDYVSPEDPDSKGIVDRAMELLENYESDLAGKLNYEIASNVDDCTQPNTIYKVRVNSGIVSSSTMMVLCVNSEGKLVQYAFARDGRILIRSMHTNESWSDWDYIPTRALTYDMIHGAVSGYGAYQADESFSVHNTKVAEYLANPAYNASDYETSYVPDSLSNDHYDQPASLSLTIPTGGSKITVFDTVTQTGSTKSISGSAYQLTNLIPNRVYIYTIYNGSGKILASGTCKASGQVRMLNVGSNAYNIRDIGGWTCNGGTLRYGLIYRGSELNKNVTLNSASIDFIKNSLGVRDEIDLRSDNDASGVTDTALGIGVDYIRLPIEYYQRILNTDYPERQQAIVNVMKRIAQNLRQNKPTYLHCQAGADRTGIICMLIEAICGVSQSDLDRDFELSSFAYDVGGSRLTRKRSSGVSNEACWKNMMKAFAEMSGTGFSDKVIRYLISIGLSVEDVNSIRDNLISGAPAKIANPYADATVTKTLTNITIDNEVTAVPMYQPYEANLRTESLYVISSFTLTMGGSDASSYYSNGRISIPRVTGNIVISATATQTNIISGNMLDTALNTRINAKADTTYVDNRLNAKADTTYVDNRLNAKADSSALTAKEDSSNKLSTDDNLHQNRTSSVKYPSAKAIVDYLTSRYANKTDQADLQNSLSKVEAYIGYKENDILGLQADFINKVFTRLAAAEDREAGSNFDAFPMYGERRRVVVNAAGEIQQGVDPANVSPNDTAYDVMIYQPKFYYRMVPLKLEKQSGNGLGYHIRKANYYISATPHTGFRLHPLFFDAAGNELDYVLLSAYEASYLDSGAYFDDDVDTDTTIDSTAVLKSMPLVKPISGQYKAMTKPNLEALANRKGSGWHLETIQAVAANQLLMMIEFGSMNTQTALGAKGIGALTGTSANVACLTGSTASMGDTSGAAARSYPSQAALSSDTPYTDDGYVAVSYRGMENPWGNIWKHVNGINAWGDGSMNGGQLYIASDFQFDEATHSGNYKPTGFTTTGGDNWISAFGYGGESFDWLFVPSEIGGTASSALPVGDNFVGSTNLNQHRALRFGGSATSGTAKIGGFCGRYDIGVGTKNAYIGGRLLFVPTARGV